MLIATEPTKDLGRVKFGKPTSFNFLVVNQGVDPLEITKLVVGCGSCTTATTSKTKLEPNEEIPINVVFTPGRTGNQTKHVSVRYNADSVLKLEFTAEVYA